MSPRSLSAALAATLSFCAIALVPAASAQGARPEVTRDAHHDISPPLWTILPKREVRQEREHKPLRIHPGGPISNSPDSALQNSASATVATTNGVNFEGVGQGFSGPAGAFSVNAAPPDTNGSVGTTQYVQWVNESFAVFDKTGKALYGPTAGNSLWSGFGGPCQTDNDGDPIVVWDKAAQRWVMTQFAVPSGGPFYQCVAVSQTSDATGAYYRYAFSQPSFNDYPKLGVWPDAYYISFNMFSSNLNSYLGPRFCAIDRTAMLSGAAATQVCFGAGQGNLTTNDGGFLPSDLDGSTPPPAGSPNYFIEFGTNNLMMWKFHVDFATPANSSITGPITMAVSSFSEACGGGTCIPQPSVSQKLDSLGDRMMYRLAYRNFGDHESLVVNHSVTAGTSTGVRWYEIQSPNGTPQIIQQSTYAPDTAYRWMGSVAMDKVGNMAMVYSVSSSSIFPSIRYTGRLVSDPLSTMTTENTLQAGTGSQSYLFGLSRWGDYSSISVDPSDDCTFWATSEYLKTNGAFNWSTRVASFSFPSCNTNTVPGTPGTLTAAAGNAQVTLSWGAASGATSYNVKRATVSGGETLLLSGVATTTYTDSAAANGTTYYYKVSGQNTIGEGPNSNEASATPIAPPGAPQNLTANGGVGQASLSWNVSSGATSYKIYRSTANGGPYSSVGTSTTNSFTNTGLAAGTYYYVVTALNGGGESGNSNQAQAIVTAAPNPDFTLSANPTSLTVTRGGSTKTSTITVNKLNGFSGSVSLSATGVPSRTTVSFSPNPATSTSTMSVRANRNATRGTYTITVRGTSGSLTHTTTASVTIQ